MLPRQDAAREFYDEIRDLFGSDENVLVVLSAEDVFLREQLERPATGALHNAHTRTSRQNAA